MAPGKTPADLIARLNTDVNAVMGLPDVKEHLLHQGMIPTSSTPAELGAVIQSDLARWAKVIQDAKITID